MKPRKRRIPQPVQGQAIGISVLAMIGMIAACTVMFFVGLGMAIGWIIGDMSVWALIVALILMLLGPAAVALGIYRIAIKERLVLGVDRFQILHRVGGEDEVITQIPYANISEIQFETGKQHNYVGIAIADLHEPNTYQKRDDFESCKAVRGFHCIIDPGYTEAIETIYEMLRDHILRFKAQHQA
jgi:hypothetical protein